MWPSYFWRSCWCCNCRLPSLAVLPVAVCLLLTCGSKRGLRATLVQALGASYLSMALRTSMLNMSQARTELTTKTMPGPNASRARWGRGRMVEAAGGAVRQAACSCRAFACLVESFAAISGCARAALQMGPGRAVKGSSAGGQRRRPDQRLPAAPPAPPVERAPPPPLTSGLPDPSRPPHL
jgi:hypothetical protein